MLFISILFGISATAFAEKQFEKYSLIFGDSVNASTNSDCVRLCLSMKDCVAISFCVGNSASSSSCSLTTCSNIALASSNSCSVLVFVDIPWIEQVNLPAATFEWMLTDSCYNGNTNYNTGIQSGPFLSINSAVSSTYTPTKSLFLGNTAISSDFLISVDSVFINMSSFSIFHLFKFTGNQMSFTLAEITNGNDLISVKYNGQVVTINISFAGCATWCNFTSQSFSSQSGTWHSFALIWDSFVSTASIYLDLQLALRISLKQSLSLSNNKIPKVYGGFWNSFGLTYLKLSIYCLKVFNFTVNEGDINRIADSCNKGKIFYRSASSEAYVVMTSNATWTVPSVAKSVFGLCIGGGGGGRGSAFGGAGSGYIAYGTLNVSARTNITATVGNGGGSNLNGETSAIGSIVVANGGYVSFYNGIIKKGSDGGSGGGASSYAYGVVSANGGSGGSNGYNVSVGVGGTGQGEQFWSAAIASLNLSTLLLTAGSGGTQYVLQPPYACAPGGGGGGGILLNGFGPAAGSSTAPNCSSTGGTGYGAGAPGAGCVSFVCDYPGPSGAQGVCIIKWN